MEKREKKLEEVKMRIRFGEIVPKNDKEKIFFELFSKFKKAIYDWGYDILWVLENYDDEKNSKAYAMTGTDFIQRTMIDEGSAADLIFMLFYNGIDVEIRNSKSSFKTEEEKNNFVDELRESVKEAKMSESSEDKKT